MSGKMPRHIPSICEVNHGADWATVMGKSGDWLELGLHCRLSKLNRSPPPAAGMNRAANCGDQIAMTGNSNLWNRFTSGLAGEFSFLIYVGPPFYCGWRGTGVIVPIVWWLVLAGLALFSEYRPHPHYNELKSRSIAFAIALVAFVSLHYIARWLSPN
jgi:hypothetical protein